MTLGTNMDSDVDGTQTRGCDEGRSWLINKFRPQVTSWHAQLFTYLSHRLN